MNDTKKYLPESRSLFRKFMNSHFKDFWDDMNNARVGPGTGYPWYYRDGEVIQHIRDITHNLQDTFGNVTIPGEFVSPKQLVKHWSWFYDFLKSRNDLFSDVIKTAEDNNDRLPEPFWWVKRDHEDVLGLIEEIMSLEEVKKYLVSAPTNPESIAKNGKSNIFDIVIITALYDSEFQALINLPVDSKPYKQDLDSTDYRQCTIGNKSVLFATNDKMGLAASAALATKVISKFSPRFLIMAGIAAGVKDDEKNYGDILVCRYTWNYESGKYRYDRKSKKTVFQPDPEQIELESDLVHIINDLKSNRAILEEIRNSFKPLRTGDKQPNKELKVFMGPMASGSAVVADEKKVDLIRKNNRKLIGIDMETFGVYHAAKTYSNKNQTKAISIKSISDFADQRKSDSYRNFAAHTSARFIYHLIQKKLL